MERYTIAFEVRDDQGWTPRRVDTIQPAKPGDTPREVALDYAIDKAPDGGDWRVRAWSNAPANLLTEPDVEILPGDLPTPATRKRVPRAGRPRHRTRTVAPASPVLLKLMVHRVKPGMAILVTRDPDNTKAADCPGEWYPADTPDEAVRAFVTEINAMIRGSDMEIWLKTSVGPVPKLAPTDTVIPA